MSGATGAARAVAFGDEDGTAAATGRRTVGRQTHADASAIAARLTGRDGGPRDRARALDALIAPLMSLFGLPGLPDARVTRDGDATDDADIPVRWIELVAADGSMPPVLLGVPGTLAALAGTVLMGGAAEEAGDEPTGIDWRLAEATVEALALALVPPLRLAGWRTGEPAGSATNGMSSASLTLTDGERSFALPLRTAVGSAGGAKPPTKPSAAERDLPRRQAGPARSDAVNLRLAATLDLASTDLRDALALRVGDVLPLADGLGAVSVRLDGRALMNGTLGQSGGRICVRVTEREATPAAFMALDLPGHAAGRAAGPSQPTIHDHS